MEKVRDFTFLKEMDVESLEELIRAAEQQVRVQINAQFTEEVMQFEEQCLKYLERDECGEGERIGVSIAVLYKLYEVWCEIQGIRCMTRKAFTMSMQSLGYDKAEGQCLVKSCAAGQVKDRLQIFFHTVPKIEDTLLQEQVKKKIHEKLTIGYWSLTPAEYQRLYALFVWFDE